MATQRFFIFTPTWGPGRWSNLTHIFQMGWNHQLVKIGGTKSMDFLFGFEGPFWEGALNLIGAPAYTFFFMGKQERIPWKMSVYSLQFPIPSFPPIVWDGNDCEKAPVAERWDIYIWLMWFGNEKSANIQNLLIGDLNTFCSNDLIRTL